MFPTKVINWIYTILKLIIRHEISEHHTKTEKTKYIVQRWENKIHRIKKENLNKQIYESHIYLTINEKEKQFR
jgi:hypothetical protein